MTGKTHVSAGLLVGALTTEHFQTDLFSTVTVICLSVVSSLLPDICHTGSKIGRKLKLLSLIIRLLFGHRTFTHSLLFIGIIVFLLNLIQTPTYYLVSIYRWYGLSCYTRYVNAKGSKVTYPIPLTIKFPFTFKTGGLVDVSLATALKYWRIIHIISNFY